MSFIHINKRKKFFFRILVTIFLKAFIFALKIFFPTFPKDVENITSNTFIYFINFYVFYKTQTKIIFNNISLAFSHPMCEEEFYLKLQRKLSLTMTSKNVFCLRKCFGFKFFYFYTGHIINYAESRREMNSTR